MSAAASGFKYRAFISYSHRDAADADWLHRAVERYRVPSALVGRATAMGTVPARLTPLFRDREELAASTDLSAVITAALEAASHLIVICSPRSASSRWVNEEILAFKRLGRAERIFAIIVDGEPNSGDPRTECFPEALRYQLGADGALSTILAEPVAADARESGDGRDNAKLKLIAGLLGLGLDDLKRRELQAQRRRTLIAYAITGLFAVLALAAVWFAIMAEQQRARADAQRTRAEANEQEAVAQRDRANKAVEAARGTAEGMIYDFANDLRSAPGAQIAVLADIVERSIGLLDQLGESSPLGPQEIYAQATAYIVLSQTDNRRGDLDRAIASAERAIALLSRIVEDPSAPAETGPDLATAFDVLGNARRTQGVNDLALEAYQEAKRRREVLLAASPDDRKLKRALEISFRKVGDVQELMRDKAAAEASYREALSIAEALDPGWPADAWEERQDLPFTLRLLGNLLDISGRDAEALSLLQRAVTAASRLAVEIPDNTVIQHGHASALKDLGYFHNHRKLYDTAKTLLMEAAGILETVWSLDSSNTVVGQDLYKCHANLATIAVEQQRYGHALYHTRRVIAVLQDMTSANPNITTWTGDLQLFLSWEQQFVERGITEEKP